MRWLMAPVYLVVIVLAAVPLFWLRDDRGEPP